ncbi:MAG: TonB-dependent receptor [Myxococcales bacterium FL481]|nr:MAG: TonB-dependent receptor [Myxococcales bacterium FL481]
MPDPGTVAPPDTRAPDATAPRQTLPSAGETQRSAPVAPTVTDPTVADPSALAEEPIEIEIEPEEPATDGESRPSADPAEPSSRAASETDDAIAVDAVWVIGRPELMPRVAGSAQTISERELERFEYDDVHRVLRRVPGVYLRGEDGFGLRPNIGLRGASSDRSAKVTLMEDGILLGPAPYSAPAAYYFPLMTRITAVDVFKGPAAVRHGPNTIGGAIDFHTREIPTASTGFLDLGLGRFDYGKAHGYWGTSGKRFGALVEGAHLQSTGFKELDGGGDTGFAKNEAMVKLRYHNDPGARHFHQISAKLGYADELSNETYLGLTEDDFDDNPYRRYASSSRDQMQWWRTQGELSYYYGFGDQVDLQVTAYRHDFDRSWEKLNRFRGGPALSQLLSTPDAGQAAVYYAILTGAEDSVADAQTLMIGTNQRRYVSEGLFAVSHWRPKWGPVAQEIEFGARLHHDAIERDHTEDGFLMTRGLLLPEGSATEQTTRNRGEALAGAVHLHDQITIGPVSLSPGIRTEIIGTRFRDELAQDSVDISRRDVVVIPGGGAHVQALPWLGVFAGVHSGFSPVAPGQAADVKPEKSINYEGGVRVSTQQTTLEATGYFNDYRNLTGECTFSAACTEDQLNRQFNAGRVHVYGAEALAGHTAQWSDRYWTSVMGTYTLTVSSFQDAFESSFPQFGSVEAGDALPYVPVHQAALIVGGGGRRWALHASGVYIGAMRDVAGQGDIDDAELVPGYFVLDVSGEVRVTEPLRLYVNVENATNAQYMVSRRPFGARPGRPLSWMAGLKYTFQ